ncbi:MAG: hypothetical protein J6D15_03835 [Clostridia bacterium]|nr:hypothetical protein [Clostridia bacterium]
MKEKVRKIIPIVAISLAVVTVFGIIASLFSLKQQPNMEQQGTVNVGAVGKRASDYAYLYVQEGLVANYVGDAKTLTKAEVFDNGVKREVYEWRNWVTDGEAAILTEPERWRATKGGIGYSLTLAEYFTADVGCELPSSISLRYEDMPSYQIELVAAFNGLTDEKGELVYVSTEDYKYGVYKGTKSTFRFGLLHSFSTVTDADASNPVYNNQLLNRWYLSNYCYEKHGFNVSGSTVANRLYGVTDNEDHIIVKNNLVGCPV